MSNYDYLLSWLVAAILAVTLPAIIAILTSAVGVIFPFVWGKFKGYRTKIISVLSIIIGAMIMISDTILPWLSTNIGLDTSTIAGIMVSLLGFVNYLMRLVTDTSDAKFKDIGVRVIGTPADVKREIQSLSLPKGK